MSAPATFAESIFGFHAQQAIEKSLKAWLSALGGSYPRTHDLTALLSRLEELECDVSSYWHLAEHNAYAVQFRYQALDLDDDPLNRSLVTEQVRELHALVLAVIAMHPGA
jgi:hypothetical protein